MNELISIIVPVYNTEKYLPECIESILIQSHRNIELILVNDGSTDNSLKICREYEDKDTRVRVVDKPNEGVSIARNVGITMAKGEYIGFVDSDDFIDPNMYEEMLSRIKKDNTNICTLSSFTVKNGEKRIEKILTIENYDAIKQLLLLEFPTSLCAYLYSKKAINIHKLNKEIHFFEDFEFNFRILCSVNKISLCQQQYYHYRKNEESANHQAINDKRISSIKICDLLSPYLNSNYKNLAKYTLFFHSHTLISIISSISRSSKVEKKYYKIVHNEVSSKIEILLKSNIVPIKYKVVLILFKLNPYLFSRFLNKFYYSKIL